MNHKMLLIVPLALIALAVGVTAVRANPAGPVPASGQGASSASGPRSGAGPATPLGSGFTYQGRLNDGASPANGQYDLAFTLFDALTGGLQVGTPITLTNQTVSGGLFTVNLDFTSAAFQGDARWLEIAVQQTGGGGFTVLAPRQPLTAAPYAMSLMPGAVVSGATGPGGIMLQVNNSTGNSMAGFTGSATDSAVYGVNTHITSTLGVGVKGQGYYYATGVEGASGYGYGVYGHSAVGPGVFGTTLNSAPGVEGTSATGPGVYGTSQIGPGGYFTSTNNYGLFATSGSGVGGYFTSTTGTGVYSFGGSSGMHGISTNGTGVDGDSSSGTGIYGSSNTGIGVYGQSTSSYGVRAFSSGNTAVLGVTGSTNSAIAGLSTASGGIGISGEADTGSGAKGVYGYSTNGIGVYGFSPSGSAGGIAVEASGSGANTALQIDNGALKVSGTYRPVFVQITTAGNVNGNATVIDNPFSNGDPNAMLIVTHNWSSPGHSGVYNNHPIGVYYNGTYWAIFNEDLATMPVNTAFNVLVVKQ